MHGCPSQHGYPRPLAEISFGTTLCERSPSGTRRGDTIDRLLQEQNKEYYCCIQKYCGEVPRRSAKDNGGITPTWRSGKKNGKLRFGGRIWHQRRNCC